MQKQVRERGGGADAGKWHTKFSACMIPADMSTMGKFVIYSPIMMLPKSKRGFMSK